MSLAARIDAKILISREFKEWVSKMVQPLYHACRLRRRRRGCWQTVERAVEPHAVAGPLLLERRIRPAWSRMLRALPPGWTIENRSEGETVIPDDSTLQGEVHPPMPQVSWEHAAILGWLTLAYRELV
jgi:hypothetical protein